MDLSRRDLLFSTAAIASAAVTTGDAYGQPGTVRIAQAGSLAPRGFDPADPALHGTSAESRLDTPFRARAERRARPFSLPCRSALHETEKLGIDHVGVCRTHAVWEPLVDLERPLS
jgi:hypothetical protein